MKKIASLLIVFVFCLAGIARGQEDEVLRSSLRVGVNRAFFGSGDIIGPGIYAEYSYSLTPYFAVTPRIMSAHASEETPTYFDHASSFGTSLAVRITPLPNTFRRLKIDLGGLYHRFVNAYGGNLVKGNGDGGFTSGPTYFNREDLFGLIGSLSVNVVDSRRIEGGLRLDMLTSFTEGYFNADSWQTGFYVGVKF